jgi:hypothetical protein
VGEGAFVRGLSPVAGPRPTPSMNSRRTRWYRSLMSDEQSAGMKSAYEIALEKLREQGVDAPSDNALSEETKEAVAAARSRAEAALAELEILHRDRLRKSQDPVAVAEEKERYVAERERIERRREREIDRLRSPD